MTSQHDQPAQDAAFWQAKAEEWARRCGWTQLDMEDWSEREPPAPAYIVVGTYWWAPGADTEDIKQASEDGYPDFANDLNTLTASFPDEWYWGVVKSMASNLPPYRAFVDPADRDGKWIYSNTPCHALLLAALSVPDEAGQAGSEAGK